MGIQTGGSAKEPMGGGRNQELGIRTEEPGKQEPQTKVRERGARISRAGRETPALRSSPQHCGRWCLEAGGHAHSSDWDQWGLWQLAASPAEMVKAAGCRQPACLPP